MQPVRTDFALERGDDARIYFVLWQKTEAGRVPLDPAGSVFDLYVSWPGGALVHSTAPDGGLVLTQTASLTEVSWKPTPDDTARLPRSTVIYAFSRTSPESGRRTYITGTIQPLSWGVAGPGDSSVGLTVDDSPTVVSLEMTDFGIVDAKVAQAGDFAATAEAQAGAAAEQVGLAADKAAAAAGSAAAAEDAAEAASDQADIAFAKAGVATTKADLAGLKASEAQNYAAIIGAAAYDMGSLDQPADGTTTFDMGTL